MNRRRTLLLAAGGVFVALAVTAVAGTYALFSDFESVPGNAVAAASVELGPGSSGGPVLNYAPLVEGVAARGELTVDYRGTVAADVSLSLDPGRATEFCERGPTGWHNTLGIALVVKIGAQSPVNYCSLLDSGPVMLRKAVTPGTPAFTTAVDLTLTENERPGAPPMTAVDALVVEATGGFSDRAEGTLTAPVEPVPPLTPQEAQVAAETTAAPPALAAALLVAAADPDAVLDPELVPRECRETEFRPDQVVILTPEDLPWVADDVRGVDLDPEPLLIFGTKGDDEITGSAAGDCIVGDDGDDTLLGADGDDVLLGGAGVDTLDGGLGDDKLYGGDGVDTLTGGPGDDALFGGAALDLLFGGEGTDTFDGGADRAICDDGLAGPGVGPGCDPPVVPTTPAPTTTTAPPPPITDPPAEQVPPPPTTTTDPVPPTTTTEPVPVDPGTAESLPAARESDVGGDVVVEPAPESSSETPASTETLPGPGGPGRADADPGTRRGRAVDVVATRPPSRPPP